MGLPLGFDIAENIRELEEILYVTVTLTSSLWSIFLCEASWIFWITQKLNSCTAQFDAPKESF